MKKKLVVFVLILLSALHIMGIAVSAFDGNDYDSGGSSDRGSSDWSSSDWDDDDDDSFSGGGGREGFGAFEAMLLCGFLGVFIIFGVGGTIWGKYMQKIGKMDENYRRILTPTEKKAIAVKKSGLPDRTELIERIFRENAPAFSGQEFMEFVRKVYVDVQLAWCDRDMTSVQELLHKNLYNTVTKQVQEKIDRGIIYHYEDIKTGIVYLTSYVRDSEYEYLTAYLDASMIDYQTDEVTGEVVKGNTITHWELQYKMKFMRSIGIKSGDVSTKVCPNCGAEMDIASQKVCSYCGTTVTTGEHDWVLSDFMTIRSDTQDDGIRLN